MKLIDADAAVEIIENKQKELCPVGRYSRNYLTGLDREKYDAWEDLIDAVNSIPTIDAEPVRHGHWIEAHDNDGLDYECSNRKCQCRISYNGAKVSGDFNYCPNCGAKMDEVNE